MAKYIVLNADSISSLENKVKYSMQEGYITSRWSKCNI